MNRLRKEFQVEISSIRSQIKELNKCLHRPYLNASVNHKSIDQVRGTWERIDSNAGLCDFISFRQYQDLKAEKDFLIEEITLLLHKRSEEENNALSNKPEEVAEVVSTVECNEVLSQAKKNLDENVDESTTIEIVDVTPSSSDYDNNSLEVGQTDSKRKIRRILNGK